MTVPKSEPESKHVRSGEYFGGGGENRTPVFTESGKLKNLFFNHFYFRKSKPNHPHQLFRNLNEQYYFIDN